MICIAGKNNIAVDTMCCVLELFDKSEIVALTNDSDTGEDMWQRSFKKFCRNEYISISTLGELYSIEDLIFLSLEYDRILKPSLFRSTKLFNIHFSKLPEYRGVYTSYWPILNGEKESGVTLHEIDYGIDTGDIIDQITFAIAETDTAYDLYQKYIKYGTMLVKENLTSLFNRNFIPKPQGVDGASYYGKNSIDYPRLKLNFLQTAYNVRNQVRAFYFPAFQVPIFCRKKIASCEVLDTRSTSKPGTLVEECSGFFIVSTLDYDVKLHLDNVT